MSETECVGMMYDAKWDFHCKNGQIFPVCAHRWGIFKGVKSKNIRFFSLSWKHFYTLNVSNG